MKFSSEFIEKVQEANNIVDLIGQYTQLKPAAGGFMGRCPFPDHQEKTPSFSVSETKQVYNCFGCHKKGNLFSFVQQYMGMNFPEAVQYLANRANIAIPEFSNSDNEQHQQLNKKKKEILKLNTLAVQFYQEQFAALNSKHPAKIYLFDKRKLTSETVQQFQIGYASEEWDGLVRFLERKGISLPLAEEARLIKKRPNQDGYYDIFRDRIIFPIFNLMGEAVAFGGRIISAGEPKYLNSGETLVFHKAKVLYGLSHSAKFIRSEDQAIVVEGYMDLVSLYQSGIQNVVATMGTALTFDHGKMLGRMTKNVVVLFDGDAAGQHAAERSLPILLSANLHPKGLILPDNLDPDDFIKTFGKDNLLARVNQASDLFTLILEESTKNFRGEASEKVRILDLLNPVFSAITDIRLKKLYLEQTAQRLKVDSKWLLQTQEQSLGSQKASQNTNKFTHETREKNSPLAKIQPTQSESVENFFYLSKAPKWELILLSLSVKNQNNFNKLFESQVLDLLANKDVKALLEKAAAIYRQVPEKFDKLAGLLSTFVDRPELLLMTHQQQKLESDSDELAIQEQEVKLLNDCIKRIREHHLKAKANELANELRVSSTPEKLERFMNIKRELLSLGKEQE